MRIFKAIPFFAVLMVGAAQSHDVENIKADFVSIQRDSPLQVVGTTMTLQSFYSRVFVINVSNKTIMRARLGWTISGPEQQPERIVTAEGPETDLNLEPFIVARMGTQGAAFSLVTEQLKALGVERGRLLLGVTFVKFADGTEWHYPLNERKQFQQVEDPVLLKRMDEKLRKYRRANALVGTTAPKCCSGASSVNHTSSEKTLISARKEEDRGESGTGANPRQAGLFQFQRANPV
jgi:hypothetical protein